MKHEAVKSFTCSPRDIPSGGLAMREKILLEKSGERKENVQQTVMNQGNLCNELIRYSSSSIFLGNATIFSRSAVFFVSIDPTDPFKMY